MSTVSASAARQTLPAQLDKVEAGEEVAITRHGKVVAVLVSPDALARRRAADAWAAADSIGALLERARSEPLRPPVISTERATELVEWIQRDRDAR